MICCIDVGNTRTKLGFFSDERLIERSTFENTWNKEIDELIQNSQSYFCSSVNRKNFESLLQEFPFLQSSTIELISPQSRLSFEIKYKSPDTLGTDRIASVEAVRRYFQLSSTGNSPAYIICDCGTATTLNILSPDGAFLGGSIMPGLTTMRDSLVRSTGNLPRINLEIKENLPGTDTATNIYTGIIFSTIGLIERYIQYLVETYSDRPHLVLTGGNSHLIMHQIRHGIITTVFPDLTLWGLFSIASSSGK